MAHAAVTEHQRRGAERHRRQHQPQAAGEVDAQRLPRQGSAAAVSDPDRLRFDDQVADGEQQTVVADHAAVAAALAAEDRRGIGEWRLLWPDRPAVKNDVGA
ncbi:MAG TPA: hypothetical protein PKB14_23275, partial [Rubrivivax sp.]|nr:hypothetical protein [Rubrivivax sp.]